MIDDEIADQPGLVMLGQVQDACWLVIAGRLKNVNFFSLLNNVDSLYQFRHRPCIPGDPICSITTCRPCL